MKYPGIYNKLQQYKVVSPELYARMEPVLETMELDDTEALAAQAQGGDVEWFTDMLEELLENIRAGSASYFTKYHGRMRNCTDKQLIACWEAWLEWWYDKEIKFK